MAGADCDLFTAHAHEVSQRTNWAYDSVRRHIYAWGVPVQFILDPFLEPIVAETFRENQTLSQNDRDVSSGVCVAGRRPQPRTQRLFPRHPGKHELPVDRDGRRRCDPVPHGQLGPRGDIDLLESNRSRSRLASWINFPTNALAVQHFVQPGEVSSSTCVMTLTPDQTASRDAAATGRPTLRIASKKSRGRPHNELQKMAVTLTAIATIAQTG